MYTVPTYGYVAVAIVIAPMILFSPVSRHVHPLYAGLFLLGCVGMVPPILHLVT